MIRAQFANPPFQDHGFWNHLHHCIVDLGIYPDGQPLIELYQLAMVSNLQSTSGTGAKPRNLALFRKALAPGADPTSGTWLLLKMWVEGVDYDDASAAGSVSVHPTTGDVHVLLSFGKKNAAGLLTYQPWEHTIVRTSFAPAVVRPPTAGVPGPAGPQGPQGVPGPMGPVGPQGPAGGGALDPADRKALDWVKHWLGNLLA